MSLCAANSGARAALCVERWRRSIAFSFALHQMYLPNQVLLLFNSRGSVDGLYLKVRSNFLYILVRYTNITKVVPHNFFVYLNECKIKVSRACTRAHTLQNSGFCFHNLHSFRCNTLGHKEMKAIYLHSFRKVSEKGKKSRKMRGKKRNIDNWRNE